MLDRSTPLARKTPLRNRAPMRTKSKPRKPAKIQFHHNRVAALGCLISGGPATLHHPTGSIHGGRISRNDRCVVPLAPQFHQIVHDPKSRDPISVEGLGHAGFYARYGIDCEATGWRLWDETEALWQARYGKGSRNG